VLKLAGGIPAGVALAFALIVCLVLWVTKTRKVAQLSKSEMDRLMAIKADIHDGVAKKHKELKKRLVNDSLEDHLA